MKNLWKKTLIIILIFAIIVPSFNIVSVSAESAKEPALNEKKLLDIYDDVTTIVKGIDLSPQAIEVTSVTGAVYEPEWRKKVQEKTLNNYNKRLYKPKTYEYTKKDLEELLLNGSTEEDIYISDQLGNEWLIQPQDLIKRKTVLSQTWDEIEQSLKNEKEAELIELINENPNIDANIKRKNRSLSIAEEIEIIKAGKMNNKKSIDGIIQSFEQKGSEEIQTGSQMKHTDELTSVTESTYNLSVMDAVYSMDTQSNVTTTFQMTNYSEDINSIYNGLITQMQINQTKKPQFSDHSGSSESVDPASGKMVWKKTDINLPGRDGLDLNIGVMFDSNNAFPYMKNYNYGMNDMKKYNYFISRYDLGMGWSFMFPSIQMAEGGYMYYHRGDGAVYQIDLNATDAVGSYTHLVGYSGKDIRLIRDYQGEFSNGHETSSYYLEYANKKREYFAMDGRLLGIVDRYGNVIKFQHANRSVYDGQTYKVISSITDTMGRIVNFAYQSTLQTLDETNFAGESIVVTVKDLNNLDQKHVTYMKSRASLTLNGQFDGYVPAFGYIQSNNNEKVNFHYVNDGYTNFDYSRKEYSNSYTSTNFSTLLQMIQYPRSVTWFQYEKFSSKLGDSGFTEEFRVRSRKDTLFKYNAGSGQFSTSVTDPGYNQKSYTYTGNYTGYTSNYDSPNTYNYLSTSSVQSSSAMNGLFTTNLFNQDGQNISTTTRASNGERTVVHNLSFDPTYKSKPTQIQFSDYGSDNDLSPNQLYSQVSYNEWGGIKSETKPLTEGQFNDNATKEKYTTSYTYEPNFYYLKTKSSYQNNDTQLTETYDYYSNGRLKLFTNAKGIKTLYTYNAIDGNVITSNDSDPSINVVGKLTRIKETTNLENNSKQAVTITNLFEDTNYLYPGEIISTFKTKDSTGQYITQTVKKIMTYDLATGLVRTVSDGTGNETSYTYDEIGRIKNVTHPNFKNLNNVTYSVSDEYSYENSHTPVNIDSQNLGTLSQKIHYNRKYTDKINGKVTLLSNQNSYYNGLGFLMYDQQVSEGQLQTTQYRGDDLGNAIYQLDPMGNEISVVYDAWGAQKEALNAYGDLYISESRLKSRQLVHYFVAASDIRSYRNNTSQNNLKSSYVEQDYNQWGQLVTNRVYKDWPQMNAPSTEHYKYDISGNLVSYVDPERNLNGEGVTTKYTYDVLNRLREMKNALGQISNYEYDRQGQIIGTTLQSSESSPPVTISTKTFNEIGSLDSKSDPAGQVTSYKYNNLGQLERMKDRNGSVFTYQYDEQSRLTIQNATGITGNNQQIKTIIGSNGILYDNQEKYTNSTKMSSMTSQMDDLKRVISVQIQGVNSYSSNLQLNYDNSNRIILLNVSREGSNDKFSTRYKYDKIRLDKVQTDGLSTLNESDAANVKYTYYPNGQIKYITYPPLADGSILKTEFIYNNLNRLITVMNMKGSTLLSSSSYIYDDNGNMLKTTQTASNQPTQSNVYTYDKLNRLESVTSDGSSESYTYDLRGNRQTLIDTANDSFDMSDTSYQYDLFNMLIASTKGSSTTVFDYDAGGMRYKKTNGTNVKQYRYNSNQEVISEVNGSNAVIADFVRGDRLLVKKDRLSNKDFYYLYNGHGDVIQIVDKSGAIVNFYAYDEWGNITNQIEGTQNSFKYAGEIYDEETGLYYLRARYYDPSLGRFLNEDTYEGQINNPLSLNLYTYVQNNPLINVDPSGNWCESPDGKWAHAGNCAPGSKNKLTPDFEHSGEEVKANGKVLGTFIFDTRRDTVTEDKQTIAIAESLVGGAPRRILQRLAESALQAVFENADKYKLTDYVYKNHILKSHGPNSSIANKSKFTEDFNIKKGIAETLKGSDSYVLNNTLGRPGYIFIKEYDKPVGNSYGKPVYYLKVVIDETGRVITAYPTNGIK